MPKVLVVATSRKTRGGITAVIKAHETGEQWSEFHCHWVQTHRDGPSWRKLLYLFCAWVDFIIRLPFYDIIHVHTGGGTSGKRKIQFVKVAKSVGKKVIVHFHPGSEIVLFDKNRHCENTRNLFGLADKIIVLAPQWINWINKAYPNNQFDMEVLWNPCPTVKRRDDIRKKQILYAGTIIDRKGYETLLRAFANVASKYPDWKVSFAGNGEIEKGRQIASDLGISSQVDWLGWISGDDKVRVFQESCIYCLASWGEGFPMGVLDAWAYGIPCIMTPVGGIPDIVEDDRNGLITPVKDINALSNALNKLISDEDLRYNIVTETDKWVNGDFSVSSVNQHLAHIYSKLSK